MQKFAGKTIWLIGATDGIGNALLKKLDNSIQANFIISARSIDKLQSISASLKNTAHAVDLDVAEFESFKKGSNIALSYNPNYIIYLPAFYEPSLIADIAISNLNMTIQTNLTAVFYLIRFTLPYLKKNPKCQLAITASVAGYIGLPRSQPYAATKAGVINLVESLKAENPELDIRLINPSFVKTKLTDKNNFKMPALLQPEEAALSIIKGLESNKFEVHFTKKFTIILKLIAALPYKLYFKIAKKMI
ncbi:SDR family NAD(P)-dependent oxidoreductase [Francisella philomiragia]|uniref:SDR family NAD(P)-dependent oxidoreductase n=1 Tax=Francisella philomiragia TaxID=28110 RepID=UPI001C9DC73F|nr:SDR family NAD(P)-dependent oxidoreductase [Francisella philomiragia]MBY7734722.1 SDR family NAD(P)-dependent oxidoreductase [Francisella philomiragia]